MGWLFAVGLGLQDRSRRSVVRALGPIALGHELAVALVAALVIGLGVLTDARALHIGAAVALVAFGLFRFARPRAHPRWTRMRVNRRELTWWSFLMSSAHGAGDRKSTRLNSSHANISYAVFCLKKKKT